MTIFLMRNQYFPLVGTAEKWNQTELHRYLHGDQTRVIVNLWMFSHNDCLTNMLQYQ